VLQFCVSLFCSSFQRSLKIWHPFFFPTVPLSFFFFGLGQTRPSGTFKQPFFYQCRFDFVHEFPFFPVMPHGPRGRPSRTNLVDARVNPPLLEYTTFFFFFFSHVPQGPSPLSFFGAALLNKTKFSFFFFLKDLHFRFCRAELQCRIFFPDGSQAFSPR